MYQYRYVYISNQRIDSMNTIPHPTEVKIDERCRICNQLISGEDEKLPLEDGACYFCMFGPTGDPEETEDR